MSRPFRTGVICTALLILTLVNINVYSRTLEKEKDIAEREARILHTLNMNSVTHVTEQTHD